MSNVRNSISLIGRIPATDKIKLTYREAQDPKHNSIRGCLGVRRNFKKQEEKYYPEDREVSYKWNLQWFQHSLCR